MLFLTQCSKCGGPAISTNTGRGDYLVCQDCAHVEDNSDNVFTQDGAEPGVWRNGRGEIVPAPYFMVLDDDDGSSAHD